MSKKGIKGHGRPSRVLERAKYRLDGVIVTKKGLRFSKPHPFKKPQSKLCFRTVVTKIPVNPFPFSDDSVTSCGSGVETRSKLEDLEFIIRESADDADEGTSLLGIGRLIIGKTGGGERPCGCCSCDCDCGCGCSTRDCDSSNRREEVAEGEGVPLP